MVAASAKSAKYVSASKCGVSYYKSDDEEEETTLPLLSPTGKPAYISPILKGFNKAPEDYKNGLESSDLPSEPKKLDAVLDDYDGTNA